MEKSSQETSYRAEDIQVLSGLSAVRKRFDVVELSKKLRKVGDVQVLSKELGIKPRTLALAKEEGRILSLFPKIDKSKSAILSRLRTDREIKLFGKKYDIYNISTRKLIKLVRKWNKDIEKNPLSLISQKEHDMIIGSLLGDASIRKREKNSCFRVAHSTKQEPYISWKSYILKNFTLSEFRNRKKILNGREINVIYLSTKTHPVFNYYRNLFYRKNKKIISREVLEQLNPRSLAVWICDDGSFSRKYGYITLCTNLFSLKEHEMMKDFFNKKFGLNPSIGFRDKKYYYLRFKKDDSQKLIDIIRPFVPKGMQYKIGEVNNERR